MYKLFFRNINNPSLNTRYYCKSKSYQNTKFNPVPVIISMVCVPINVVLTYKSYKDIKRNIQAMEKNLKTINNNLING